MAKEKTYKVFNTVLYPDSTTYNCAEIINTVKNLDCEWFAALHDKDKDEQGNLKKPHYHVMMRFCEGKTVKTVAKDLQLPENVIERPKKGGFRGGVKYLIHANAKDKYQYDKGIIFGSGDPAEYLGNDADEKGMMLMDAIYSGQVYSIYELYQYAKEIEAWSEFRRGYYMYSKTLESLRFQGMKDSVDRRSDAEYEERRQIQSELMAAREELGSRKQELMELPQEIIPEFGET